MAMPDTDDFLKMEKRNVPTKFMDVKTKVALVTGGARGIGLAIADSLLTAGLKKAFIADIDDYRGVTAVHEMIMKHGDGKCSYMHLDVNNPQQFEDVFKDVISKEGSIDILVNNAGIINEQNWELEIDTNIKSVMRGCMLAMKYMPTQKNKGGCVLNVASILGFDGDFIYTPGYTCTKHAVIGLTRTIGDPVHYKENGIRFIAIGPGVTNTNLVDPTRVHNLNEWAQKGWKQLQSTPSQNPDVVGRGAVYMIQHGPPGSLWVVEEGKLYRVILPERKKYQIEVMNL